ncbi:MAG: hypothetical protein AB1716_03100 [Planctomycetota bacterium]
MRASQCADERRAGWFLLALPLVVFCCGCPVTPEPGDGDVPTIDPGTNRSVQSAATVALDETGAARFRSNIVGGSDVDVFDLGPISPGDAIRVDVQRVSGDLDPVAAIFDIDTELVAFSDDRTPDSSDLNPLIDFVLRAPAGRYYLGVIAYPGSGTTGEYETQVRITRQVGVPSPRRQTVFLDWRGGQDIVVPNVGVFDLPAFNALDVGLPSNQTAALKGRVLQIVRDRYADFNIVFVSSDDAGPPAEAHATVYFGGRDPRAFAISEAIDPYNQDPADTAIIFTGGYRDAFSVEPNFEELAQAVGNTVAHEVGHLLGLVHTADCSDLMDTSCPNDRILSPQQFETGRLDRSVFPFGFQPSHDLLSWILGLVGV